MTTKTPTLATAEILTEAQASTNMPSSAIYTQQLDARQGVITPGQKPSKLPGESQERPAKCNEPYQQNLATVTPQPVCWLWSHRLPLAGITILDGDHSTGKSLLALHIAASVSAGPPLPDGSPTIQGGVIIITPNTDARTTQLQLLTALGADLSKIEILTFIQDHTPASHPHKYHPFMLPEDLSSLFQSIECLNARLIIIDPFIHTLSCNIRYTNQRLAHLLTNINQHLIERNIACLLTRTCGTKGRHARPTALERSDHFVTIAVSRLLLAPDPFVPNHLCLCHALNLHASLTPTLKLQIQPLPDHPDLAHITIQGSHTLQAKELIENRPDTLHRKVLSNHLLTLITASPETIPVTTLYNHFPHSSLFQIQRTLRDLLNTGHIQRPARGFYRLATAPPSQPNSPSTTTQAQKSLGELKQSATTTQTQKSPGELKQPAATTQAQKSPNQLKQSATTTQAQKSPNQLKQPATTTQTQKSPGELKQPAATTQTQKSPSELKQPAATTQTQKSPGELKQPAATTQTQKSPSELKQSAATTQTQKSPGELKQSATTTQTQKSPNQLKQPAATTQTQKSPNQLKQPAATTQTQKSPNQLKQSLQQPKLKNLQTNSNNLLQQYTPKSGHTIWRH